MHSLRLTPPPPHDSCLRQLVKLGLGRAGGGAREGSGRISVKVVLFGRVGVEVKGLVCVA